MARYGITIACAYLPAHRGVDVAAFLEQMQRALTPTLRARGEGAPRARLADPPRIVMTSRMILPRGSKPELTRAVVTIWQTSGFECAQEPRRRGLSRARA